jgi:hypothetical protein
MARTPLVELLDVHPYPWRTSTSIAGPPGNAQVSIFDATGIEVEVLDDSDYAEAIVEAVNLAADQITQEAR